MSISVEPDNMPGVLALAERFADVYATLGVHPHEAAKFSDATAGYIQTHAAHDKVVAVGEIGLDYFLRPLRPHRATSGLCPPITAGG